MKKSMKTKTKIHFYFHFRFRFFFIFVFAFCFQFRFCFCFSFSFLFLFWFFIFIFTFVFVFVFVLLFIFSIVFCFSFSFSFLFSLLFLFLFFSLYFQILLWHLQATMDLYFEELVYPSAISVCSGKINFSTVIDETRTVQYHSFAKTQIELLAVLYSQFPENCLSPKKKYASNYS